MFGRINRRSYSEQGCTTDGRELEGLLPNESGDS